MSINTDSLDSSTVDEPVNAVVQLPFSTKSFEAAGHKYYVESTLSIGRYKHYQRMEVELGFNVNFSGLVDKIKGAYNAMNERRDADASVLLKETLEGSTFLIKKIPISLYVATLFVNRADEDRSDWSTTIAEEKIEHWKNIDANFFLTVALGQLRNFPEKLQEITNLLQNVSQVRQKVESLTDIED